MSEKSSAWRQAEIVRRHKRAFGTPLISLGACSGGKFVEMRLRDLRKLLNAEPRVARAEIGKHVQKIKLTQDGRAFVVSGEWYLLGNGAVAVK